MWINFYDKGSFLCVQSNNCNILTQQIALVTIITSAITVCCSRTIAFRCNLNFALSFSFSLSGQIVWFVLLYSKQFEMLSNHKTIHTNNISVALHFVTKVCGIRWNKSSFKLAIFTPYIYFVCNHHIWWVLQLYLNEYSNLLFIKQNEFEWKTLNFLRKSTQKSIPIYFAVTSMITSGKVYLWMFHAFCIIVSKYCRHNLCLAKKSALYDCQNCISNRRKLRKEMKGNALSCKLNNIFGIAIQKVPGFMLDESLHFH